MCRNRHSHTEGVRHGRVTPGKHAQSTGRQELGTGARDLRPRRSLPAPPSSPAGRDCNYPDVSEGKCKENKTEGSLGASAVLPAPPCSRCPAPVQTPWGRSRPGIGLGKSTGLRHSPAPGETHAHCAVPRPPPRSLTDVGPACLGHAPTSPRPLLRGPVCEPSAAEGTASCVPGQPDPWASA